jgi:uncharacterized protein
MSPMTGPDRDGAVVIHVASDELLATVDVFPHQGAGKPLDLDSVEYTLLAAGVTSGIDRESIAEGIRRAEENGETARGVVAARGAQAADTVPLSYEILITSIPKTVVEGQNVDYREPPRFPPIHKNDQIAIPRPRQEGKPGLTVTGKELPFKDAPDQPLEAGDNVAILGNGTFVARDDGRLIHDKNRVRVESALLVEADVDFSTGNIRFPKDVVVGGNVLDDFILETNGSLVVKGVVGAAAVSAKGPVEMAGGFSGKGRGRVRSGAEVAAAYIDNGAILCLGDLSVANEIVNSNIRVNGKVVCLGKKGTILGGTVAARDGIECTNAGSPRATATRLAVGVDVLAAARLAKAEEFIARISQRITGVDASLKAAEQQGRTVPSLQKERAALVKRLNELTVARDMMEKSLSPGSLPVVSVRAKVFPGVTVSICGIEKHITAAAGPTTYTLDLEKRIIVGDVGGKPEAAASGRSAAAAAQAARGPAAKKGPPG